MCSLCGSGAQLTIAFQINIFVGVLDLIQTSELNQGADFLKYYIISYPTEPVHLQGFSRSQVDAWATK